MVQDAVEQRFRAVEVAHGKLHHRADIVQTELVGAVIEHNPSVAFVRRESSDLGSVQLLNPRKEFRPGLRIRKLSELTFREIGVGSF